MHGWLPKQSCRASAHLHSAHTSLACTDRLRQNPAIGSDRGPAFAPIVFQPRQSSATSQRTVQSIQSIQENDPRNRLKGTIQGDAMSCHADARNSAKSNSVRVVPTTSRGGPFYGHVSTALLLYCTAVLLYGFTALLLCYPLERLDRWLVRGRWSMNRRER